MQLCGYKALSDNMLRQGFAIKTIKNAGMKTHMETSGKWSRRASTQKRFWNQFVSKILSLRRILYSAGPLSWSHPPSSVDNVKNISKTSGETEAEQDVVI